ncbi:MAG: 23S rRNA (guanosine(2251)-2'-O)-methyltransferase RlmB [Elusimicrobiota bacterium]|jgi:23S rRNA (guanosine2251-2'-O)-methyltransferase|nr:23S rRNA (guanosine(2251)-2'-O)-methyltransferase RlmB [Elusimicrobiota bacterium]
MEHIDKDEVLFGAHPVREALKSRKRAVLQLYITGRRASRQIEDIIRLAKTRNVKIKSIDDKTMDRMAGHANHQGVIARVEPLKTMRLSSAIYDAREAGKKELWLAVDEITDPQNLGSMLRSAACLGFTAVLLPRHRSAGITPVVHKVASGALETLKIVEVQNLTSALLDLKEEGFWVYGADMAGKSINTMDYAYPAVLIIGNEGAGLREKTKEHCDQIISIPQEGGVSSLNAAAAAAIIMYDIYNKRK